MSSIDRVGVSDVSPRRHCDLVGQSSKPTAVVVELGEEAVCSGASPRGCTRPSRYGIESARQ
jgi:hypothetical protein